MNKFYSLVNLTKLVLLAVITLFASQTLAHRSGIDRIVAFGASLTDSGNSSYWLSLPENQTCGTVNVPPVLVMAPVLLVTRKIEVPELFRSSQ